MAEQAPKSLFNHKVGKAYREILDFALRYTNRQSLRFGALCG